MAEIFITMRETIVLSVFYYILVKMDLEFPHF